jgi:hypothetical protein
MRQGGTFQLTVTMLTAYVISLLAATLSATLLDTLLSLDTIEVGGACANTGITITPSNRTRVDIDLVQPTYGGTAVK